MSSPRILNDYSFLQNEQGKLALLLSLPDCFPEHPRIFYDGGAHALFCRTPEDVYLLINIPSELRHYLAFEDSIQVVERREIDQRQYEAKCHYAHSIPALAAIQQRV